MSKKGKGDSLIRIGVWGWGANLQYLQRAKIVCPFPPPSITSTNNLQDVPALIQYPLRLQRSELPHYLTTYRLALALTIPLSLSLFLFWALSHRSPTLVIFYDFLPLTYLFFALCMFLVPWRVFSFTGRYHFLRTLRRVSKGGIAKAGDGKFGDILLADVLTSYAKIIADLFVALCMFFTSNPGSATARPDRGCGGQYLVPIIIAIPSLIRFRQCIIEYLRVRSSLSHHSSTLPPASGWGGQHLANALKYFSAFPVIIFSALQRNLSLNHTSIALSPTTVYRLWLLSVFVNSFYSFYWDVAKDWDLTLFSRSRSSPSHPFGLRPKLFFPSSELYYGAIIVDLLLRCTWSLKLSPHLDHFADFESGIFLMELLEVGRRWMWIFFRVETEWVRSTSNAAHGGPEQDDILMGDYGSGRDDDSEEES